MLRIVVIDDEKNAIDFLCGAIEKYCPNAEVAGFSDTISNGLKEIADKQPDVVLLDIAMPSGNGFELLDYIPERNFEVIFITAYNEYAIQAFRYSAVDYLLKPVDVKELVESLDRVSRRIKKSESGVVDVLLDNLQSGTPKKLSLPTSNGFEYVLINDIIRIEAERSYCCFYLTSPKKYIVSRCLNEYDQLLEKNGFFRVHNSHLINLKHVKSYFRRDGGFVEMIDSSKIPISRTRKDIFLHAMRQQLV